MSKPAENLPDFSVERDGSSARVLLRGAWTIAASRALERAAQKLAAAANGAQSAELDFAGVTRLDTAGAWLIDKARQQMAAAGVAARFAGASAGDAILLREAAYAPPQPERAGRENPLTALLVALGGWTVGMGEEILRGVSFLGELAFNAVRVVARPKAMRPTSMVFHLENFALRAVPIIATINFLVGCIVAQQGIFQLRRFGASTYAIDMVGVLVLRELGVLLTAIMIAGRSGSAITAELGSMKMREEVDALRVMGISPMEALVLPRLMALVLALPMLTVIGDFAALFGGMVTSYFYNGVSPQVFAERLQLAIGMNTYLVGLIKAPFMALVIGMIAAIEGFKVEGSAESLGRRVTASVVNSIFMVIFLDGLFAIFFASINY
ncbi:phospholipid/cholesterol/gamma-HCH transport system permease protein [Rhodoblastus acidophilus]|uniref:Phospholipid/cholesterol/gamma-HCH transport system permease protein n=1 Tax=Rhodoblastus acidophilus TaxID=1074 RepID=A0A212PWG3_RHOAC|nr:ABC transporter permease [Rhodoblastus acidophilus]MCW2316681.1 phospholipid/cholesterol/gamma-HCH transport system permease protein [Rhodoblastus acidophilus]PPQ37795.1 ABC transporter permease [Rhodoblastus acidophilus]RAI17144.1 ABC transporter permease [Rhodoblastus acidophilus]SNB51361.1 phospholipid/cholesterol/gamma-HCH transport system permease protein [Rhodoblastus acidophilus]